MKREPKELAFSRQGDAKTKTLWRIPLTGRRIGERKKKGGKAGNSNYLG